LWRRASSHRRDGSASTEPQPSDQGHPRDRRTRTGGRSIDRPVRAVGPNAPSQLDLVGSLDSPDAR
jgi:hypothetical protein